MKGRKMPVVFRERQMPRNTARFQRNGGDK